MPRHASPRCVPRSARPDPRVAITTPVIEPLGESVLVLRFDERVDLALNARVHAVAAALRDAALPGVRDLVPAYASLAIHYDPLAWITATTWRSHDDEAEPASSRLAARVGEIVARVTTVDEDDGRLVEVPVHYGGDDGPDLPELAAAAGLSVDDAIARHAAVTYRVAMLGFAPGFPYLLGLDAALHAPRLASPRTRVPAGSVAIGGAQTGIYPSALPGGWRLVGRTPLVLFDASRPSPALLRAGDRVRFVPA